MKIVLIEAWVEGVTPMLQCRATAEALEGSTRSNNPTERDNPRDVCEKAVYRLPDSKQLAVPGSALARMLREAGGSHKAKGSRKSLKYIVPAAVLVLDELCGLYLRDRETPMVDYEVDSRPVTIPATKGRVMRHRARFNEWAFKVNIRINEDVLDPKTVRQLMVEGLQQIGLGDYRPEKGGPMGTGSLVAWNEISERKPKTPAQIRNGGEATTAAQLGA